jgi:hypothetical protein
VIPTDSTSFSIHRVLTPSRYQVAHHAGQRHLGAATRRRGGELVMQKTGRVKTAKGRSPRNLFQKHCERSSKGLRGGRLMHLRHAHHQGRSVHHLAGRHSARSRVPLLAFTYFTPQSFL